MRRRMSGRALMRTLVATAYWVAAAGYLIYSLITETGVMGWLLDVQMNFFGSGSLKISMLLAMVALGIGYLPIWWLAEKLSDSDADTAGAVTHVAAAPPLTRKEQFRRSARGVAWMGVGTIAASWVLGYPIYRWIASDHSAVSGKTPAVLKLEGAGHPGAVSAVLTLDAVPQFDHALSFSQKKAGSASDYYVPLTGRDWTPEKGVRFVLHFKRYGKPQHEDVLPPYHVSAAGHALPGYVSGEWARSGLKVHDPHYMVERVTMSEGGVVADRAEDDFETFLVLAGIGSMLGALFLVAAGGIWLRSRAAKD